MQSYQHGNETLYFEDGVSPAEMEAAARRIDQQRGAANRAFQRQEMMNQIKNYLAHAEDGALQDEEMLKQAREEAVMGHQRYVELRHEEQQRAAQEAAQHAAEAAERDRVANRSFVEILNDKHRLKTSGEE